MVPLFTKKAKSLMKGNRQRASEGAAGAFHPPPVGEVGGEPSFAGLTGHAYLKGKI